VASPRSPLTTVCSGSLRCGDAKPPNFACETILVDRPSFNLPQRHPQRPVSRIFLAVPRVPARVPLSLLLPPPPLSPSPPSIPFFLCYIRSWFPEQRRKAFSLFAFPCHAAISFSAFSILALIRILLSAIFLDPPPLPPPSPAAATTAATAAAFLFAPTKVRNTFPLSATSRPSFCIASDSSHSLHLVYSHFLVRVPSPHLRHAWRSPGF